MAGDTHPRPFRLLHYLLCRATGPNDRRLSVEGRISIDDRERRDGMVRTVEDTAVPRHRTASEGPYFAFLMEGIVSVCESRVRSREGTNQIVLCGL